MSPNPPFRWLGVVGLAAFLYAAPAWAQAPAPRFELELDLPDEVTMANRPSATGTNVRHAKTQRMQLKRGRIEEMVSPPVVEALRACTPARTDAGRYRIRISEGVMKDSIGDSLTPLKGIGLYLSLPESGVVNSGTWSASPYMALVLELKDDKGRVIASREVNDSERLVAPLDMTAGDFVANTSANLDHILDTLVRGRLAKAMPVLLAGTCAPK